MIDSNFNFSPLEHFGVKLLDIVTPLYIMLVGTQLYINPSIFAFLDAFGTIGKAILFWTGAIASTTYALGRAYLTLREIYNTYKNDKKN